MTLMFLLIMPTVLNLYIPSTLVLYGSIFVLTIIILIPAIWLPVKAGQAGSRLKPVLTPQEENEMKIFSTLSIFAAATYGLTTVLFVTML